MYIYLCSPLKKVIEYQLFQFGQIPSNWKQCKTVFLKKKNRSQHQMISDKFHWLTAHKKFVWVLRSIRLKNIYSSMMQSKGGQTRSNFATQSWHATLAVQHVMVRHCVGCVAGLHAIVARQSCFVSVRLYTFARGTDASFFVVILSNNY